MIIRKATEQDGQEISEIYKCAFPADERDIVANLAVNLLSENTTPETLSLVSELDNSIVGHIAFSPVFAPGMPDFQGYILAPLAVIPKLQHSGYGSKLIDTGILLLSQNEIDVLFVYGDPNFYSKFGFSVELARGFIPPYELKYPLGWQAKSMKSLPISYTKVVLRCVPSLCDPQLW
jgi:putative acetyltransferase